MISLSIKVEGVYRIARVSRSGGRNVDCPDYPLWETDLATKTNSAHLRRGHVRPCRQAPAPACDMVDRSPSPSVSDYRLRSHDAMRPDPPRPTNPSTLAASLAQGRLSAPGVTSVAAPSPRRPAGRLKTALDPHIETRYSEDSDARPLGLFHISCKTLLHDPQLSATRMAKHIYGCKSSSLDERVAAWSHSKPLSSKLPDPRVYDSTAQSARVSSRAGGRPQPSPPLQAFLPPPPSPLLSAPPASPSSLIRTAPSSSALIGTSRNVRRRMSGPAASVASIRKQRTRFPDRITEAQAASIVGSITEFFVENRIPFEVVESTSFKRLMQLMNPALLSKNLLPSRKALAGPLLENLYLDVTGRVTGFLGGWSTSRSATLALDGWTNVAGDDIVNVLVVLGNRAVFLDSIYTDATRQSAENQANLVLEVVGRYKDVLRMRGVASDNTASCLSLRGIVAREMPGVVPLNDQSHAAVLMMEDFGMIPWVKDIMDRAESIVAFVTAQAYLLAEFKRRKDDYNKAARGSRNSGECTVVMLQSVSSSRFTHMMEVVDSVTRAEPVLRQLVDSDMFEDHAPAETAAKGREQSAFVQLVKDSTFWDDAKLLCDMMAPGFKYLRLWESDDVMLNLVYRHTVQVVADYEAMHEDLLKGRFNGREARGSVTASELSQVVSTLKTRAYGPRSSSVRILLLQDIHFFATLLDPNCPEALFSELYIKSSGVLRKYFVNSADVFSPAELEDESDAGVDTRLRVLSAEIGSYIAGCDKFGIGRSGVNLSLTAAAWWRVFGTSTPHLQVIAVSLAELSASSCSAERWFSQQKNMHPLLWNRGSHNRVKKLMYCHWNLRLLSGQALDDNDFDFIASAATTDVEPPDIALA